MHACASSHSAQNGIDLEETSLCAQHPLGGGVHGRPAAEWLVALQTDSIAGLLTLFLLRASSVCSISPPRLQQRALQEAAALHLNQNRRPACSSGLRRPRHQQQPLNEASSAACWLAVGMRPAHCWYVASQHQQPSSDSSEETCPSSILGPGNHLGKIYITVLARSSLKFNAS